VDSPVHVLTVLLPIQSDACCRTSIAGEHASLLRYCTDMYGQLNEPPLSNMSRINVSIGVLPTRRTKNSCSMTCADIVRSDGSRSSSLPKRVGCPGYWVLTYSSRAHWDFSWIDSTCVTSDMPHASAIHSTGSIAHTFPV